MNSVQNEQGLWISVTLSGSHYNQDELVFEGTNPANEAVKQPATSASRMKILLENRCSSEISTTTKSSEDVEPWDKLCRRMIVSSDMSQENLVKFVSCQSYHSNIKLLENITGRRGLGAMWKYQFCRRNLLCKNSPQFTYKPF